MAGKKNRYIELIGIAAQMGVTIFLGAYFGKWLDERYASEKKWFTIGMTLLAVFVSLYLVIKQVNKIKDDE